MGKEINIEIVDDLMSLIWKLWKYRKGGYSKEEAADLADNLMELAMGIVSQYMDKK